MGVNYKCDGHLDPRKLMTQMISYLKNGVTFYTQHQCFRAFETSENKINAVIASGKKFTAISAAL